tara:strand:- start:11 stop:514 length:504 start_codon:yes stop_codon:yes gene_type:complete
MIVKKLFLFFVLLNLFACSQISFIYDDSKNLINPFYNKTTYEFSGTDIASAYRYAARYFGNTSNPTFYIKIKIEEETSKRSVQSNQAVSKLDYELTFIYSLSNLEKECSILETDIVSKFSYVPKSSGYNFGSDQSLQKLYELAVKSNITQFIDSIKQESLNTCKNES